MDDSRRIGRATLWPRAWFACLILFTIAGSVGLYFHIWPRVHGITPEPGWAPPVRSDRWKCIVIHHSASDEGGAARFDTWHRQRGWDELGYHFVIGNGTDSAMGQVEVGPRWTSQKHGAHTKTDDEFYNQHGIGICLVGNFDKYPPSAQQMQSLAKLVGYLCQEYRIPVNHIYTHGGITHKTDCPGKYFDVEKLKAMVNAR